MSEPRETRMARTFAWESFIDEYPAEIGKGLGDFGTEAVTAAIANAFITVTQQRLRHLPFSRGRVLETLGAQTP